MNALERTARKVISVVISDTDTITEASDVVAILERELHWTELVETLRTISRRLCSCQSNSNPNWHAKDCIRKMAQDVLSKIEGVPR